MNKHNFLVLVLCLSAGLLSGQSTPKLQADKLLLQKANDWKLTSADLSQKIVSDMYVDNDGNTHIYYQQTVNGIPIANAITPVVVSKKGKTYCVASRFIANAKSLVSNAPKKLTPQAAIQSAAKAFGRKADLVTTKRSNTGETAFFDLQFVHNEVTPQLEYVLVNNKLELVWSMNLDLTETTDYWNAQISAADGRLIAKHNYVIYCTHQHGKYDKHESCMGHITKKKNITTALMGAGNAQYNTFSFPTESPIHGERSFIKDNVYPDASPYGWHDTDGAEGAEYTITRGNNVHVHLNKDATDFSKNDEPDGGAELNFDFPYDINADAEDNKATSQVNLFTAINQLHDVLYTLGFDEKAGSFQVNNYGKGGRGADPVKAYAFDGITLHLEGTDDTDNPHINNANFTTPADGGSGVMRMYLWENKGGLFSIDTPSNISGFIQDVGTADFGNPIPTKDQTPITGVLALARDNDPVNPTRSCKTITNTEDINGKIAIIDRGECNFSLKVYNAQQAGATACIICNIPGADGPGSSGETIRGMTGGDRKDDITIPSIFLAKSTCDLMRSEMNKGNDVTVTLQNRNPSGPKYRDSGLDNGVVAHEYGHGLSNRLIGGPGQSRCLTTKEQMGEGISDFVTLLMTLKEGDTRDGARGIGNYVDYKNSGGSGIRTYPYSTDLSVNPRNYDQLPSMQTSTGRVLLYSIGEIWTSTLWDMLWNIVDKKGIDSTWKDENAGNFVVGRLFIKGMQFAPCNPSLIDMRDAILAADELLYDNEHEYEIWSAFAKRGMGYKATGGSSDNLEDGESNFDILPLAIKTLKINKSGKSLVKSGEEITVTLSADNHIPMTKYNVVIADQIPEGATYVQGSASLAATLNGNELTFSIDSMIYKENIEITYKIRVDEDLKSTTTYYDDIDKDNESNYQYLPLQGFSLWQVSDLDANSGEKSLYVRESATAENQQVIQIDNIDVMGDQPILRFYHKFETQKGNDGGFLSISSDGTAFKMVPNKFIRNGYNTDLSYNVFAIPNLRGFSGSSEGKWVDSYVDLSDYKGQNISLQFRFGSDESVAASVDNPGWFVDDIEVIDLSSTASTACISTSEDDRQCSQPLEILVNSDVVTTSTTPILLDDMDIKIGPNPTDDYLTVEISAEKATPISFTLLSIDGKVIARQYTSSKKAVRTFDVSELQSGVYLMQINTNEGLLTTQKVTIF